jgi:repressor LexA
MPGMKKLTAAQSRVLDALRAKSDSGDAPPTYRELQAELGFRSTGSVRDHLRALERKGYLTLGKGRFRSVRLSQAFSKAVSLPVLGRVVAGVPIDAQEELQGFVEVPSQWVRGDTFALRVSGNSMKDAGILDGDIAVLRRDLQARKGQVVCATVEGETTLKIFEPRKDGVWLAPANPVFQPIRLTENSLIQGVLLVSYRLYSKAEVLSPAGRRASVPTSCDARSRYGAR